MLASSYLYFLSILAVTYTDKISANPDEGVSPQKLKEVNSNSGGSAGLCGMMPARISFYTPYNIPPNKEPVLPSKVETIQGPHQSSISKCGLGILQWGTVPRHIKRVKNSTVLAICTVLSISRVLLAQCY